MIAWLALAHAEPTALDLAYQREFAYLQAERDALADRKVSLAADAVRRLADAEAALTALQARRIGLTREVTALDAVLADATREGELGDEAMDVLDSLLFQADSALGTELPDAEDPAGAARALSIAWQTADARLVADRTVAAVPGAWFTDRGARVDGRILKVGRVAAFGLGPDGGALLPLGEGRWQRAPGAIAPLSLDVGQQPASVELFLFEDTGKPVTPPAEKTWAGFFKAGGAVGWVIVAIGVLAAGLVLVRGATLLRARRGAVLIEQIAIALDAGDWELAVRRARSGTGPTARVLQAVLDAPADAALDDRAAEAVIAEAPRIERFGAPILVIAAIAPLLGLLGTVTGMIATFDVLTEFGTANPRMLSGGISEALITTQLGLVVAIPALVAGNLLGRTADSILGQLERAALTVLTRRGHKQAAPPERKVAHA